MKSFLNPFILLLLLACPVCTAGAADDFDSLLDTMRDPFEPRLPPKIVASEVVKNNNIGVATQASNSIINQMEDVTKNAIKNTVMKTPTVPSTPMVPAVKPTLLLQGVMWQTDKPQAIVGDQLVGLGDKINEATIVGIFKSGIEVDVKGTKFKYYIE